MKKNSYIDYSGRDEFTNGLIEKKGYKKSTARVYARALKNKNSRSHKKSIKLWEEIMVTGKKEEVSEEKEVKNPQDTNKDTLKTNTSYDNKLKTIKSLVDLSNGSNNSRCLELIKAVMDL